ncbi:hypothetical protein ACHAWU_000525, partial [Discostella pseudostelligera]
MVVSSRGSNTNNNMIMTLMDEAQTAAAVRQRQRQQEYAQQEVQLLTMTEFDPRVRVRFGGLVTARSVKYLGKLASKLSDQETRDGWWSELRDEIRSHARTLCCSHVIGYMEYSTIHEDVCVLTISGTAAAVRGLPDKGMAQRMWAEWELKQAEVISGVDNHDRGKRNRYPGDSSPGSVISTNADTPFSAIETPFSGGVSDDGGERGHDEPAVMGADIVK